MNDLEPEATPTFDELRSNYALSMCRTAYYDPDRPAEYQRHLDEFDRCMAGHDAEVKVMFARPAAVPVDPEIVCGVLETMRREEVRVSVPASRREATADRILTQAQGRVRDALASMPRPDVNERDALERALDEAAQRWEHGTVDPGATLGEVLADAALAWFLSRPSSAWFAGRVEPALWDLLRRDGYINVADWSTCVETAGRHPGSPIALLVTAHRRNVAALLETLGVPPSRDQVSSPPVAAAVRVVGAPVPDLRWGHVRGLHGHPARRRLPALDLPVLRARVGGRRDDTRRSRPGSVASRRSPARAAPGLQAAVVQHLRVVLADA